MSGHPHKITSPSLSSGSDSFIPTQIQSLLSRVGDRDISIFLFAVSRLASCLLCSTLRATIQCHPAFAESSAPVQIMSDPRYELLMDVDRRKLFREFIFSLKQSISDEPQPTSQAPTHKGEAGHRTTCVCCPILWVIFWDSLFMESS